MKLTVKLPNFTLTRGKVPSKPGGGLRNFRRNFKKYLLWGFVGLFFFVLFAWLSLPTRAIAWRMSHEAKAQGFLIDIEDVSISPFGGATLENVRWTFQPSRPDQVPMTYIIEEVDVDISLISLIAGNIDVDVEIEFDDGDDGRITANYYRGSDESSVEFEIAGLPLYRVPKANQSFNAPLRGIVALKAELTMPEHKFGDANGTIDLTCASCLVGDGVETLFVPGSKSLKKGIEKFPEVDLGTLEGHMTVEKGAATIDKPIETNSEDLWIEVTGGLDFRDPFGKSRAAMVLKFNLKDKLLARSEALDVAFKFSSEKAKLGPDQPGLGFRLEGPIAAPRFIPIQSKSRQQSRAERRAAAAERDAKRSRSRRTPSKPKPTTGRNGKQGQEKPTIGEPLDVTPIDEKPSRPGVPEPSEPPPTEPPPDDQPLPGSEGDDSSPEGNNEEPAAEEGGEEPSEEGDGSDNEEEAPAEEQPDGVEGEGGEGGAVDDGAADDDGGGNGNGNNGNGNDGNDEGADSAEGDG